MTKAPRLKKTDGAIDWSRPAAAIKNQIRAGALAEDLHVLASPDGPPVRLILGPASVLWCRRPACESAGETPAPQRLPLGWQLNCHGNPARCWKHSAIAS